MASAKWEVQTYPHGLPNELMVEICRDRGENTSCIHIVIRARENRMSITYNDENQTFDIPLEFLAEKLDTL